LLSLPVSPQGDVYNGLAGTPGNSTGSFIATSGSKPAFDGLVGSAFGELLAPVFICHYLALKHPGYKQV
jgi:hypothetical protein